MAQRISASLHDDLARATLRRVCMVATRSAPSASLSSDTDLHQSWDVDGEEAVDVSMPSPQIPAGSDLSSLSLVSSPLGSSFLGFFWAFTTSFPSSSAPVRSSGTQSAGVELAELTVGEVHRDIVSAGFFAELWPHTTTRFDVWSWWPSLGDGTAPADFPIVDTTPLGPATVARPSWNAVLWCFTGATAGSGAGVFGNPVATEREQQRRLDGFGGHCGILSRHGGTVGLRTAGGAYNDYRKYDS